MDDLSPRELEVFALIKGGRPVTLRSIMDSLGLSRKATTHIITRLSAKLSRRGFVVEENGGAGRGNLKTINLVKPTKKGR